ncbi:MAG: GntR family transcriptional regulator [Alicyclobacillus sp.]|nr:GntR family transcriptional regulator [Alicyclobacillus sp.]
MYMNASGHDRLPLGEHAYRALREAILALRLYPGQTVYESEFTNMLNMSRTPIREAVRMLVAEDLIEVLPQRGMKIALISLSKVEETRFVREVLEVSALRKLMADWNPDGSAEHTLQRELKRNLELQREAVRNEDYSAFLYADEDFHRLLLNAANNATLVSIVTQMRAHLNRVRMLSLQQLEHVASLVDEHQALVDSIMRQDESQAVTILTQHLRRLSTDLRSILDQHAAYFTT